LEVDEPRLPLDRHTHPRPDVLDHSLCRGQRRGETHPVRLGRGGEVGGGEHPGHGRVDGVEQRPQLVTRLGERDPGFVHERVAVRLERDQPVVLAVEHGLQVGRVLGRALDQHDGAGEVAAEVAVDDGAVLFELRPEQPSEQLGLLPHLGSVLRVGGDVVRRGDGTE
jgi:hypothetical protein